MGEAAVIDEVADVSVIATLREDGSHAIFGEMETVNDGLPTESDVTIQAFGNHYIPGFHRKDATR